MAWEKIEPSSVSFTQVVGADTYIFTLTTQGAVKRGNLQKNGVVLGQYIDFPDIPFTKDLFTQVGPLL